MTLHDIRSFLGLSQSEIGRRIGLDRRTIHNMEKGGQELSTAQCIALSRIFGDEIIDQIKNDKGNK